jgi:serine protease
MKKHNIFFLILSVFFSTLSLYAQNNYYYYKGQKIYLQLEKKYLNLNVKNDFQVSTLASLNIISTNLSVLSCIPGEEPSRMIKIEFQTIPNDIEFLEKINFLKKNSDITNVGLHFKKTELKSIGTSNIFYVKLKNNSDIELLKAVALEKNVKIENENKFMPLWYKLSCTNNSIGNSLELSNSFYETGLFADIDPAFMFDFKTNIIDEPCSNDSQLNEMWGFLNSANPNIDINICEAWNITEGNGIKVAIMDSGVDKTHIDLSNNIDTNSFDTCFGDGSSPSQLYYDHGTGVAGIIAAVKDNGTFIAGVAPQSKILDISNKFLTEYSQFPEQLANGINWAWQNGADVINNSYGDQGGGFYSYYHSALLENAFTDAMTFGRGGLGCIVAFSSGNWTNVDYPANSNPDFLVVGATNVNGERSIFSSNINSSAYGQTLDVVAPGSNVITLANGDDVTYSYGTSIASPHIAGVAALILSVNPCLSNKQVRDIIERTSQKVGNYVYSTNPSKPNGAWNNEMGYGLVDAYASVQLAQAMNSPTLDLMVRDGYDDFGIQPNTASQTTWNSPDIWVRNQEDGVQIQEHQNPKYFSNGNLNHIYIRVTNKSCTASNENDQLKLYYALNRFWLKWPNSWNPILPIGQISIPQIQPGKEVILSIPWNVPNPNSFPSNSLTFDGSNNFSLLARIESNTDVMAFPESGTVPGVTNNGKLRFAANVRNNNNIAWKNVTTINVANTNNTVIALRNLSDETQNSYLELVKENSETGKSIYEEAEVSVKMDETLYSAWERGGKLAEQLNATTDIKKKLVKGNNVILDNISLNPNEIGTLQLSFNFLTKEITEKNKFTYHVVQRDKETGEIIGGETITIEKNQRDIFSADAGETKIVDINEPITIRATQISEPVVYNWYDTNGNLIFSGKDLTIATQVATKYKLEVIATSDGFKDYSEVEVKLKPSVLSSIAPNPATNNVVINYKVNEAGTAYLMIISSYGTSNSSNNYILNTNSSETNIDISNYPIGFYTVALVCNGQIVDAKTLIKN